jgi:hypothetical protein
MTPKTVLNAVPGLQQLQQNAGTCQAKGEIKM